MGSGAGRQPLYMYNSPCCTTTETFWTRATLRCLLLLLSRRYPVPTREILANAPMMTNVKGRVHACKRPIYGCSIALSRVSSSRSSRSSSSGCGTRQRIVTVKQPTIQPYSTIGKTFNSSNVLPHKSVRLDSHLLTRHVRRPPQALGMFLPKPTSPQLLSHSRRSPSPPYPPSRRHGQSERPTRLELASSIKHTHKQKHKHNHAFCA